jgi:hypothetical protein
VKAASCGFMAQSYFKIKVADLTKAERVETFKEHMNRSNFVSFDKRTVKGEQWFVFCYEL